MKDGITAGTDRERERESFVDAKCLKIINRVIRRLGFINYASLIKNTAMMINDADIILNKVLRSKFIYIERNWLKRVRALDIISK